MRRYASKRWVPCRDLDGMACKRTHNQYETSCGFRPLPRECLYASCSINSLGIGPNYQYQSVLNFPRLPKTWYNPTTVEICYYSTDIQKKDRSIAKNYRPVSLTSVMCKIREKIIVIQISEHPKTNRLTCPAHNGFNAGHSTITNLLDSLNVWTEALMHRHPIYDIYLDDAKYFDTVPHQRLPRQIYSFGIQNTAIDLIRAFLTWRRQRVRINRSYSA